MQSSTHDLFIGPYIHSRLHAQPNAHKHKHQCDSTLSEISCHWSYSHSGWCQIVQSRCSTCVDAMTILCTNVCTHMFVSLVANGSALLAVPTPTPLHRGLRGLHMCVADCFLKAHPSLSLFSTHPLLVNCPVPEWACCPSLTVQRDCAETQLAALCELEAKQPIRSQIRYSWCHPANTLKYQTRSCHPSVNFLTTLRTDVPLMSPCHVSRPDLIRVSTCQRHRPAVSQVSVCQICR